ncbi:hypothetical protein SNA_03820 [Streptomyces natalensis ATCC 27448]|uniref:Uncharacterized protein n=1 Tax=Streptomyces natalensis ATCC 27448 TaxID=1240678 RepID=A0A0D7CTR6_9ACTN|nr:hypothetical protein SNA_03820 [Streptomyces natalensis ATCC 27448]
MQLVSEVLQFQAREFTYVAEGIVVDQRGHVLDQYSPWPYFRDQPYGRLEQFLLVAVLGALVAAYDFTRGSPAAIRSTSYA